jgi:hypothetical protein
MAKFKNLSTRPKKKKEGRKANIIVEEYCLMAYNAVQSVKS